MIFHVAGDGRVWTGDQHHQKQLTHREAVEMVACAAEVRLLGAACNAQLIVELHAAARRGGCRVLVGTPQACSRRLLQNAPLSCLAAAYALRDVPPCLGGYHDVTDDDGLVYAMCCQPEDRHELAKQHSVWQHAVFCKPCDEEAVAELMSMIIDPRWYINACRPSNCDPLLEWLGLDPYTQRGVCGHKRIGRHHERCALVQRVWMPPTCAVDIRRAFGQTASPDAKIFRHPRAFMYRDWLRYDLRKERKHIGVLRASQRYVRYLWYGWLATTEPAHPEVTFVPEYFFKTEEEVKAYRENVSQMCSA